MTSMDKANYKSMSHEQLMRARDQLLSMRLPMHDVADRDRHLAFIANEIRIRFR